MSRSPLPLLGLALVPGLVLPAQEAPGPIHLALNDADLKDLLRAATQGTQLNLVFEPGIDTRVHGLNLRGVSLDEMLEQILPCLGFACERQGRTLLVRKASGIMRFYRVEQLAMTREGTKSFQVNASGQTIQLSGSSGGGSANQSAYTSSVKMVQVNDLWADLETGLQLLVFGQPMDQPVASQAKAGPPGSRSFMRDGKRLLIQANPGIVAVEADPATQARVAAYLEEMRQRIGRQVLLEARIVEVKLSEDSQIGVDWSGVLASGQPATGSLFQSGVGLAEGSGLVRIVARHAQVQATLSALARDQRLKVLSAPRLSALNNQKAILRVVREEAFALQTSQITPGAGGSGPLVTTQVTPMIVPVGIVLDIHPQIGDDGVITLGVNPSISELVEIKSFHAEGRARGGDGASGTLPVVERRDLDTVVRIRSGETLVLAGMIRTREHTMDQGVPWLRKLPIIGQLFAWKKKERERVELAIFISPTLVDDAQAAAKQVKAEERLERSGLELAPPAVPAAPGLGSP